jgi:molybdopterin synthase sulfur carrier subunit
MIRILFFASLREMIQTDHLEIPLDTIRNVQMLREHLQQRGERWQRAFQQEQGILVAVNQQLATAETSITDGDEIGFFPPVTGG